MDISESCSNLPFDGLFAPLLQKFRECYRYLPASGERRLVTFQPIDSLFVKVLKHNMDLVKQPFVIQPITPSLVCVHSLMKDYTFAGFIHCGAVDLGSYHPDAWNECAHFPLTILAAFHVPMKQFQPGSTGS